MNTAKSLNKAQAALPILALIAVWLLTISPLTQQGKMTCSHDGILHWLRAFQLDELVQQGILWPRWAPGLVFGYGYPLFNYYPALSLYPMLVLHRLGLNLLASWNATLALSLLASGLSMYLWARQVMRQPAAFISAAAYMLAPYQLYDVYWRGTLTESLTLPMLPLALWAAQRTAQTQRWRYVVLGALVYAAILLTHVPASLIFSLLLASYSALLLLTAQDRRRTLLRLAGLVALGCGLTVFMLVPAFLERDQVQFARAITLGEGDYAKNFLAPGDVIGPVRASDPLLLNPPPVARSLGWALGGLAALGILFTWLTPSSHTLRQHVAWAALMLALSTLMILPISHAVWSSVPLLPYIQLPWRFLGTASLLAALLAGASIDTLMKHPGQALGWAWTGVCLVALSNQIVPWAYPRLCPMPENPDWTFSADYEEQSGFIGTTTLGEYLPIAVREVPKTSPMLKSVRAGQPVMRWDATGARIVSASDNGLNATLIVESDQPTQVMYRAFYFPGWRATLDDLPVELKVAPPFGLMAIDVPAGQHELKLQFENTPLRTASEIASLVVALAMVVIWILDRRSTPTPSTAIPHLTLPTAFWWGTIALSLTLLALKTGVIDRVDTPLRSTRFKDDHILGATSRSEIVVAGSAQLLGYDLNPSHAASGQVIYVDLYWTLNKPLNFLATVHVLDEQGLSWSSESKWDATTLKGYNAAPSSVEWPIGQYAQDRHAIRTLPGTPSGSYALVIAPYDPDTLEPLSFSAGQPAPGGQPGVVLGQLEVTAPAPLPSVEASDLIRVDVPLGSDLTLVGYSQDREQAAPGQTMLLALSWQARAIPRTNYSARLELMAADGQMVAQQTLAPGGEQYPTTRWASGQFIRSQVLAHIPGRLTTGQYTWRLTLFDDRATYGPINLKPLQIDAPPRVFDPPPVSHSLQAQLGDHFLLTGYDLPARITPGASISVTLMWQSIREVDRNYKVFVHLLDTQGQLVSQSDAVPGNWTRPTSGWQAGEYVTDSHLLVLKSDLAPGEYRLVAGMYDIETRQRLPVASRGDVIELGKIQVSAGKP